MHHTTATAHTTFSTTRKFSLASALAWVVEASHVAGQRRALAGLDAAALKDLGLTREQANAEAHKPFWA